MGCVCVGVGEGGGGGGELCLIICLIRYIQSTLVISKLKGPSETLRDIHTLTYQMCRTEENTNRTTKFHK